MTTKPLTREALEFVGVSLITIKDTDNCLGDLIHFEGKGTYDPSHGRVPVSKDEAAIHNAALDVARVEGMDRTCEIGQGSFAYLIAGNVSTFAGTVISVDVSVKGRSITFKRAGKTYRGRAQRDADYFNFRRIA